MLFPYTFVPHSMDKMQEFINYVFFDVWCNAIPLKGYDLSLFDGMPELKKIVEAFHYSDAKGADLFNSTVEEVYGIFQLLNSSQKDQLKQWYELNNNVQKLCEDPSTPYLNYDDLETFNHALAIKLKAFFPKLYGQGIITLKAVSDIIGNIDDHYNEFIKVNKQGICPFCGINDIDGNYVNTREAYDHFLPKKDFPFNTINFTNLSPMCNKCNSSNKGVKNPLADEIGIRRKAFFPYGNTADINIEISIHNNDMDNLKAADICIVFSSIKHSQEVETWKDVFGIEKRYQEKCASQAHGKYWFTQILEESEYCEMTPKEMLEKKLKQISKSPFSDNNFLRKAFLEACDKKGLFND